MLLRGPSNVPCQRLKGRHSGEGEYAVRTLFEAEFGSLFKHVRDLTLFEHSTIGEHPHADDEELFYIVEGEGVMTIEGEEQTVGPGDCILTQSGSSHGLRNEGKGALRILVVCTHVPR